MKLIKRLVLKLRGQISTEELVCRGMTVGKGFSKRNDCKIDASHAYMITIGDHVTLAGGVTILAHDASTKMHLGYTKIAPVNIGSYVFIGERAIILQGVTIGDNVIIGAGSVVTKNIESGMIVAGNPAKPIGKTDEYIARQRALMEKSPLFGSDYVSCKPLPKEKIEAIQNKMQDKRIGFII